MNEVGRLSSGTNSGHTYHPEERIRETEWETESKPKHKLYEWFIVAVGLLSMINTYMGMMTKVLVSHLWEFLVAYPYTILTCSTNNEERPKHLAGVFGELCVKGGECSFRGSIMRNVGEHISFYQGQKEVLKLRERRCHGLASACRKSIENLNTAMTYIIDCIRSGKLQWTAAITRTFEMSKGKPSMVTDILSSRQMYLSMMEKEKWTPELLTVLCEDSSKFMQTWLVSKGACEVLPRENHWLEVRGQIRVVVQRGAKSQMVRGSLHGVLYIPLLMSEGSWGGMNTVKAVVLFSTHKEEGTVMIASNENHFIAYKRAERRSNVAKLYSEEVTSLKLPLLLPPTSAVASRYWESLWKLAGCNISGPSNIVEQETNTTQGNFEIIKRRWRNMLEEKCEAIREGIGVEPTQKWESIAYLSMAVGVKRRTM